MTLAISPDELLALAAALAVAGAVAGLLAGIFGIGGGGVIVPILYQFLGMMGYDEAVRMHVAIGTSLGIILPTGIRSFAAHKARGVVDHALLRSWLVPVPLGVALAAAVAASVSGAGLRAIFAAIAVLVGLRLVIGRGGWRLGDDLPGGPVRAGAGIAVGFLSTLMGIGGGVMSNTFMTLYGRSMLQAVATSAGVGVLVAVPGTLGYMLAGLGAPGLPPFSVGYVNLLGVVIVIPLSVALAPLGVRIAHALSRRQLELGFGLFLLAIAARFFWSLAE